MKINRLVLSLCGCWDLIQACATKTNYGEFISVKKSGPLWNKLIYTADCCLFEKQHHTPCIFYHSLTSKEKQSRFIKTIKRKEIDAYNYCHGSVSFEKAVREFYK